MLNTLIQAFHLVTTWEVIISMMAASVYGLVIGSLPGLSATMATALLVPVTFYLSPIAERAYEMVEQALRDAGKVDSA